MTEAKSEKIPGNPEKERGIALGKINEEIASLLLNESKTEKTGRHLAYEKMGKVGSGLGNKARYEIETSKGRLFRVDMWNDEGNKGEPVIFFKSIDGSETRKFSAKELGRLIRNRTVKRVELTEETKDREAKEQEKSEQEDMESEKKTPDQIVDSIVTPEVIAQYHDQVKIGDDREKEAIDSFKDELATRFDGVDLANSVEVQEAVDRFFNLAKNKDRPLVKIIKQEELSIKEESSNQDPQETEIFNVKQEDGPEDKEWEKKPYKKIIENYLVARIIDEHPELEDVDKKIVQAKLKSIVSGIEEKMKDETPSGLDGDNLSFGSIEEIHTFINEQLVGMVDKYASIAVDLSEKDGSQDKEVNKKDEKHENGAPESLKEFRDKYESNVFYVNKNDASDLTIVDYNPTNKQVTVHLSYKFREEPSEEISKEGETTPVWSIDQRGGKKIMFFEKFEKMMNDYVLESEFHKKEFKKEEKESRANKTEDARQTYKNKKGETLETYKYKRGDIPEDQRGGRHTKRKVRTAGTLSIKINGGEVQEVGLDEFNKIKEGGGFLPVEEGEPGTKKIILSGDEAKELRKMADVSAVERTDKKGEKPEKDNKSVEQLEFSEREKKVLHAFGRFAVVWLDDIEKYDYEGAGIQTDQVERETRRQSARFWAEVLPEKIKEKGGFRSEELVQKAITQIEKEFER